MKTFLDVFLPLLTACAVSGFQIAQYRNHKDNLPTGQDIIQDVKDKSKESCMLMNLVCYEVHYSSTKFYSQASTASSSTELDSKLSSGRRLLEDLQEAQSSRLAHRPNDVQSITPDTATKPSDKEFTLAEQLTDTLKELTSQVRPADVTEVDSLRAAMGVGPLPLDTQMEGSNKDRPLGSATNGGPLRQADSVTSTLSAGSPVTAPSSTTPPSPNTGPPSPSTENHTRRISGGGVGEGACLEGWTGRVPRGCGQGAYLEKNGAKGAYLGEEEGQDTVYRRRLPTPFTDASDNPISVYCYTALPDCGLGPCALVMKSIHGSKELIYDSPFWTNKESLNPQAANDPYTHVNIKLPTYWASQITQGVCLWFPSSIMAYLQVPLTASSLYASSPFFLFYPKLDTN
ncbi:predicted protein [Nematostella vectensis]|uniref:Uncharacterized protein n=1 Tax=Nematostella vectensis TaxID=45351 RepID=A7SZE4_NEMVE|nr:predicted protein [Nematostella vectensis]|eukprot:XP_001623018.1 hypothetical protein NEMVEDRAFT_v1g248205 [Nematostella vectensis]